MSSRRKKPSEADAAASPRSDLSIQMARIVVGMTTVRAGRDKVRLTDHTARMMRAVLDQVHAEETRRLQWYPTEAPPELRGLMVRPRQRARMVLGIIRQIQSRLADKWSSDALADHIAAQYG